MDGFKVEVYGPTGATLIGQVLPSTISMSSPLGGKGVLTMTVPPTDPLMVANPGCLDDCVLIVSVPDGAGGWVEAEPYGNRVPCQTLVALDNGDLVWQVTAASLDQLWGRDAVILPEYAVGGDMPFAAGRERAVSWASSAYDPADDAGFWDDLIESDRSARPTEPAWPTGTGAVWITCSDVVEGNRKLYRAWLDVDEDNTPHTFYASGDEAFTLWVAGEQVLSTDDVELGRKYTRSVTMILAAGRYAVGIDTCTRVTLDGTGDGVDPVILAVAVTDGEGDALSWPLVTNDTDWVGARLAEDTGVAPGPTVGAVLVALHDEAQGIDIASWDALTLGFDANEDSDGVDWYEHPEMVLTYAGDDYATIIDRLSDNQLDCRITPALVLEARIRQGMDLSASVALGNVTAITPQVEPALGNTAHVLTLNGWITVKDSVAYTAQGRRPMFLQLGTAQSTTQGMIVATNAMPDLAYPQVRHAVYFSAAPGARPLIDFGPGDHVDVPVIGRRRVLALSGSWDGTTEVAWVAEVCEEGEAMPS